MSKQADISIIVPCYNAQRYLNVCLESLKAQKEPQLELIFIDDGSTDETGAMLDAFAAEDTRAKVFHIPNGGVSHARNLGLDHASGRYIAFVDADDALEENSMRLLHEEAIRTGAQIVSANHTLFDEERSERIPVELPPVEQLPDKIAEEIIHMHRIYNNIWNKLYVRELFEGGLSLDETVRIGEDALLNLQLYMRAKRVGHLPEYTYVYRIHGHSAMAGIKGYSEAHQPMLRSMRAILLRKGAKELNFRDYLQSCIWMDEKESGIVACMRRFNKAIRPLVLDGVEEKRILQRDRQLYRLTVRGYFPAYYIFQRVREKITGRKWGIRR